ncbi:MAG: cytochrome c peroxidase [Burkholderiaceae bacterium]
MPRENDFERIPQDPSNPLTEAKVRLGAMLFHDTSIAGNPAYPDMAGTYSCASCHHASAGFRMDCGKGSARAGSVSAARRSASPIRCTGSIESMCSRFVALRR